MGQINRLFGVVGKSLSHSFSPAYFAEKFQKEQIFHCEYKAFELETANDIISLFKEHQNLVGVNVTIPHKTDIIPFLDEIEPNASTIGAVNTIKRLSNGKLKGYNTDSYGFGMSIKPFFASHHERALVFGDGGAAQAIKYVLKNLGVSVLSVVRNSTNEANQITYDQLEAPGIEHFKLLINTTPVGTFPNINDCINIPYSGISKKHLCFDLVYNPDKTEFLKRCETQGAKTINGLNMLKLQAEKSWEIWHN